jgi:hypothetical protein
MLHSDFAVWYGFWGALAVIFGVAFIAPGLFRSKTGTYCAGGYGSSIFSKVFGIANILYGLYLLAPIAEQLSSRFL